MPRASANISAKFIAQIEMSNSCAPRNSIPAADTRPRMVSISGSPAATSEPKASRRIASVTGHEMTSDLSMALLLASLKSDHMPADPVSSARTPAPAAPAMGRLRSSAARTMSSGAARAPATTSAVCPSGEMPIPGRGGRTSSTRGSASNSVSTRRNVRRKPGSPGVWPGELTTTWSA